MRLSDKEQREFDILVKEIRQLYELLESGAKDMSPTNKLFILPLCKAILFLYEKTNLL